MIERWWISTITRRIAWWTADTAVWISISFSVVAHVCRRFADHHARDMTPTAYRFIVEVGQCFGHVSLGWIVISAIFAITCRVRYGVAKEKNAYLVLVVLALVVLMVATGVIRPAR